MPPKRKSTSSNGRATKKAKSAAASSEPEYVPPRSKRWSAVSASANAEADYRMVWKDEKKAYSYVTLCSAFYLESDDEEDEEEDEDSDGDRSDDEEEEEEEEEDEDEEEEGDEGDSTERLGPRCGKKRCQCFKPYASNPEHPWVISWAGHRKFMNQFLHAFVRNPDNFSMYTWNDHAGSGILEVIENLLLDYEDAAKEQCGEWREHYEDGDRVNEIMRLVGRMFLAMLAQLDGLGLVGDATAVQSLGCTMAMYMDLASIMRSANVISDEPRKEYTNKTRFQPDYFEDAVLTYANRRGVTLQGPDDIEELMAQADGDIELPEKGDKDPWGWKAAFKKYAKDHGRSRSSRGAAKIGGDDLDITTWSPAERKSASLTKKDPFTKKDIEALKNGLILSPG
ncbi:hypothetical protein F5Y03DRAFT_399149 [Xylaria venustula]|nr:hypothetical protein F5Y03DRAFT_399149 [Xylaria venustula]